jgi:filamentous hemagglutinin family protein
MLLSSAAGFAGASVVLLSCLPATAQIIPDNTLGNENSVVIPNQNIRGIDSDRIEGGAIRDANLFHSFQEFNINDGQGAYFANPEGIVNILSRVTGSNLSNILGTLGVLGNANLFLINPNGIVFGPNARLDVGGSFFATTADSVLFDNFEFSASNPEAPPLLTINIPIGLNFRDNPGSIVNQTLSTLVDSEGNIPTAPSGLYVPPEETIALIGGEVRFESGVISSPGSRLELGGLSEAGIVELNTDGSLSYPRNIQRSDVLLTEGAIAKVVGNPGGSVAINARNLELSGESQVGSGVDNISNSFGSAVEENLETGILQAGDVRINATESVILTGQNSVIGNVLFPNASGNAGNVDIQTNSLSIQDGAFISALTSGNGNGGNLTVTATDVELIGTTADGKTSSSISTQVNSGAIGDGGILTLNTQNLRIRDGAFISTSTFGNGNGGNLTVTATHVELIGRTADGEFPSAMTASVEAGGVGQGGDLTINTQNLQVREGARILASTFGNGNGGNLTVTATDIELIGNVNLLSASVEPKATGNAGNVTINTQRLLLSDGSQILASTFVIQSVSNSDNITNFELDIQQLLTDVNEKAQQLQNPRGIAYSLGLWGKYYEFKQDWSLAEKSTVKAFKYSQ